MPRPKTKKELLTQSQKNFEKLMGYISSFSGEEKDAEFPEGTMNRNIRDVLAHLHHWHLMVMEWYEVGMAGKKPDIPAKGYTWKTTPVLKRKIWEQYNTVALEKIQQQLAGSHAAMQELAKGHTDEELFEKKRYKWTGTTSLGAYLISATSSHYDWAYKLIRKAKK